MKTVYTVECFDRPGGQLLWREVFDNLVVTVGLDKLLDATFKTGLTTPAWYVGLKGAGAVAAGNTMASHSPWAELTSYSEATREVFTPGTIVSGSVDNSASKAEYNITGSMTVAGAFLVDDNTKGGSTGVLYGVGDFATPRSVVSGNLLRVQGTLVAVAA